MVPNVLPSSIGAKFFASGVCTMNAASKINVAPPSNRFNSAASRRSQIIAANTAPSKPQPNHGNRSWPTINCVNCGKAEIIAVAPVTICPNGSPFVKASAKAPVTVTCRTKKAPPMASPSSANRSALLCHDAPLAANATHAITVATGYASSLLQHAASAASIANGTASVLPCSARSMAIACINRKPTANKSKRLDGQRMVASANGPSANSTTPATTPLAGRASARNKDSNKPALAACRHRLTRLCDA